MGEVVKELQKLVGVKIPEGTIRQWVHQELISGPKSYGLNSRRGCFYNWPWETVTEAAVIYTLRHAEIPWARTIKGRGRVTTARLLATKKIADRYYTAINEFSETGDLAVFLEKYYSLNNPAPSFFLPPGVKGVMFGGADLQPLVVYWIVTLEKVRHNKPLSEPIRVIFNVKSHFIDENGNELWRPVYDGITFESSDDNLVKVLLSKL